MFEALYHRVLDDELSPLGFRSLTTTYVRQRPHLLHVIALNRPTQFAFTADVALLPTVYPTSVVSLEIGAGVHRLAPDAPPSWPTPDPADSDQVERVLRGHARALRAHAIPWLDCFQGPGDLVRADRTGTWGLRRLRFTVPYRKQLKLGICALADGDARPAVDYLQRAARDLDADPRSHARDWVRADAALVRFYLDRLAADDWDAIKRKLIADESFTLSALGVRSRT
jgi:hypothetical protein